MTLLSQIPEESRAELLDQGRFASGALLFGVKK